MKRFLAFVCLILVMVGQQAATAETQTAFSAYHAVAVQTVSAPVAAPEGLNRLFETVQGRGLIAPAMSADVSAPVWRDHLKTGPPQGVQLAQVIRPGGIPVGGIRYFGGGYLVPDGGKVVVYGDSTAEYNYLAPLSTGTASQIYSRTDVTWAFEQFPNFNFDAWGYPTGATPYLRGADQGVAGQTTTQILARSAAVIALTPDIVIVNAGINNVPTAMDPATGLPAIYSALRAGLPNCVIVMATMMGTGASTATTNNSLVAYVAGLRSGGDNRVFLWDKAAAAFLRDPVTGAALTWNVPYQISADSLHLNSQGGQVVGVGYDGTGTAPYSLVAFLRSSNIMALTGANQFAAFWSSAATNFIPDPYFTTTPTAIATTGITGFLPAAYVISRGGTTPASTTVVTIVPNAATGGNSLQLDITPIGTSVFETITITDAQASAAQANQWIQGSVQIRTDGAGWLKAPSLKISDTPGRSILFAPDNTNSDAAVMVPAALTYKLLTAKNTMSATPGTITEQIVIGYRPSLAAGVPTRIIIDMIGGKIVADPGPVWGY